VCGWVGVWGGYFGLGWAPIPSPGEDGEARSSGTVASLPRGGTGRRGHAHLLGKRPLVRQEGGGTGAIGCDVGKWLKSKGGKKEELRRMMRTSSCNFRRLGEREIGHHHARRRMSEKQGPKTTEQGQSEERSFRTPSTFVQSGETIS